MLQKKGEDVGQIHLSWGRIHWWVFVKPVMNDLSVFINNLEFPHQPSDY